MSAEELRQRLQAVIARHGPWTAHDIDLGQGVSTLGRGIQQQWRVEWFDALQRRFGGNRAERLAGRLLSAADALGLHRRRHYAGRRILDLACLEGLFAIEFARFGAATVGVEIRESHLAKAEFARDVLGLAECRFVRADVRAIPAELGSFDTVICAGILYHLDFPDCVAFLRDIAARSTDLVILDSHFAYDGIDSSVLPLSKMRSYAFAGRSYRGRQVVEHAPELSDEEKARAHPWASIDNEASVWLAESEVVELLREAGFALARRAFPFVEYQLRHPDRPTLVFKRVRAG